MSRIFRRKRGRWSTRRSRLVTEQLESRRLLAFGDAFGYWSMDGQFSKDAGTGENDYVAIATSFPDSQRGRAMQTGYTVPFVDVPLAQIPGLVSNLTVAAWARPDRSDDGGFLLSTGIEGIQIGIDDNRALVTLTTQGGGLGSVLTELEGEFNFQDDTWYHVAASYDSHRLRLFVNGDQVAETFVTGKVVLSNELRFGNGGSAGFPLVGQFLGQLDDVQMYLRTLSPEEIRSVMEAPSHVESSGSVQIHQAGSPVLIDPGIEIASHLAHFGGGTIAVTIFNGSNELDVLGIAESEAFTISENKIFRMVEGDPVEVGSILDSSNNTLRIRLTNWATPEAVERLARLFTFDTAFEYADDAVKIFRIDLGTDSFRMEFGDEARVFFSDPTGGPFAISTSQGATPDRSSEPGVIVDPEISLGIGRPSFEGGTLTARFAEDSYRAGDRLRIASLPEVFVTGLRTIRHIRPGGPSVPIGQVTGGLDGEPLRIEFNENAFALAVQDVARAIEFVRGNSSSDDRFVRFTLTEPEKTASAVKRIEMGEIVANLAPELTAGDDVPVYRQSEGPVVIGSTIEVSDPDSPDFSGGEWVFSFAEQSAQPGDRLQYSNTESVTFGEANVLYRVGDGSVVVGTWQSTENGQILTVTLGENATPAIAEQIARAVRLSNTADSTTSADRLVRFSISDGDGGSDFLVRRVEVVPRKVAPVIEFSSDDLRINEEAHPAPIDDAVEIGDADAVGGVGVRLRVTFAEQSRREGDELGLLSTDTIFIQGPEVRFVDGGSTIKIADWSVDAEGLVVEFNEDATMAMVQTLARAVAIDTQQAELADGDRFIRFVLTDVDQLQADEIRKVIVFGGNDRPEFSLAENVVPVELGEPAVEIAPSALIADIDSPDFAGGHLIAELIEPVVAQGDHLTLVSDGDIVRDGHRITLGAGENAPLIGEINSELTSQTKLVIDLTENATPEVTQALARRVRFGATEPHLVARTNRLVRFIVDDGDGGASDASKALSLFAQPDDDTDGIEDSVEDGAPNDGDGNRDGKRDRHQDNVASLPGTLQKFVTISAEEGKQIVNAVAVDTPEGKPEDSDVPVGLFDFSVHGLTFGSKVIVTIHVEPGVQVNSYMMFGKTPDNPTDHWYNFAFDGQTGAKIFSDRIELHLIDGLRGDSDLRINGEVADPGAPTFSSRPWQNPMVSGDVNRNGDVTAGDALNIINDLSRNAPRQLPLVPTGAVEFASQFLDVSGDNQVSALDALLVINAISRAVAGESESVRPSSSTQIEDDDQWDEALLAWESELF